MLVSVGFIALTGASVSAQEGDPDAGAKVFNRCKVCHVADEAKNRVGPTLHGVFGRTAGTVEGFKYSDAMKESEIVWTEETIAEYISDPKAYVPGNRMAFAGLRKEEDIANLLAYLRTVAQ
jgi:cytochrome c